MNADTEAPEQEQQQEDTAAAAAAAERAAAAGAATACVLGPAEELCRQLEGVCSAQRAVVARMEEQNAALLGVARSEDAQEVERLAQRCAVYAQKAHQLRGEMTALTERTRRLRRRADVLQEKKRKYDEQVLAKERSLVAVDLTQAAK